MFAYSKATEVGRFWIRPDRHNGWSLSVEKDGDCEILGSYSSAVAAADDVFTQHTGYRDWDFPRRPDAPTDLGEWQRIRIRSI